MKTALLDLISSKKFITALIAVIAYITGRFGLHIDDTTLDRVYFALLAYVGAQGIADNGKEAAKINAGTDLLSNLAGELRGTGAADPAKPPTAVAVPTAAST